MTDVMDAALAMNQPGWGGPVYPLRLDDPTYIVGPGPNGYDFARQLDTRESVIALNKACEMKAWRYWLCIDANAYRCDWYHRVAPSSIAIMGKFITDKRARYTMELADCPEATGVCGAALNICYNAGLKHVVLVGVDMQGGYYDGTPSSYSGEWAHLPHLRALIDKYMLGGMNTWTASRTALDIPTWG